MAENNSPKTTTKEKIWLTITTFKYLMKTSWKIKKSMFFVQGIGVILSAIHPFVNVIFPKFIIDELLGEQNIGKIILYVVLTIALSQGISMLISVININMERFADFVDKKFEVILSERAMSMDFEHTENPEVLDQLEKAKQGISWYSGGAVGMLRTISDIITSVITLIGSATLFIFGYPIMLVVMGISIAIITYFNGLKNSREIEDYKKLAVLNRSFGYYLFSITRFDFAKDFRLYGSQKMLEKKAVWYTDKSVGVWKGTSHANRKYSFGMDVVSALRDGFSYLFLGLEALAKRITIGDFTMYLGLVSTFNNSVQQIVLQTQEMYKKSIYAHEYVKFMSYPDVMPKGERKVEDKNKHEIEFKNVSFIYPRTDEYVLKDVSITLKQGDHLSVVGLNGAGKTTFIKLLCRLYDVSEGEILLDGINIKEYDYDEYMSLMSVVFQDFSLFAFRLGENVALGDYSDSTKSKTEEVMAITGLEPVVAKLEKGIDTYMNKQYEENGTDFSGGEQQKLAIARALYKDSPIVILDEPTAALDPMAEYEIYRQFNSLVEGKTAIYISHRLSSCKFCDNIAVFSDNTIKEFGTHDELVSLENGVYREMFEAQAQYYK